MSFLDPSPAKLLGMARGATKQRTGPDRACWRALSAVVLLVLSACSNDSTVVPETAQASLWLSEKEPEPQFLVQIGAGYFGTCGPVELELLEEATDDGHVVTVVSYQDPGEVICTELTSAIGEVELGSFADGDRIVFEILLQGVTSRHEISRVGDEMVIMTMETGNVSIECGPPFGVPVTCEDDWVRSNS